MFYFRTFPKRLQKVDSTQIELIDITIRSKVLSYVKEEAKKENNQGAVKLYLNDRYKRPEQISFELYSTYDYTWTILVLNEIYNIHTDWVMPEEVLEKRIRREYGTFDNAQQTFVDFYDEYGYEVSSSDPSVKSRVSAFEKIFLKNEEKKDVKVFDPSIISKIQADFERDML